jgi:hypothetical protein
VSLSGVNQDLGAIQQLFLAFYPPKIYFIVMDYCKNNPEKPS